jgi:hypothetical protein
MAIPDGVTRFSFVGTGPSGEVFDTSFWVFGVIASSSVEANDQAALVRQHQEAGLGAVLRPMVGTDYTYTEVRAYAYPTGGPAATYVGAAAIAGGAGTGVNEGTLQTAMVVTLNTGFAGRSKRGRMYLPHNTGNLIGHRFDTTQVTNVANEMADFFSAINADTDLGDVIVLSQIGTGSFEEVDSIKVDNRPDVQRRRASQFAASFTQLADVT